LFHRTREEVEKYENMFQMLQNVDMRLVNKKVLESLIQCGALDSLEGNRSQQFNSIEMAIEFAGNYHDKNKRNEGQHSLFDLHEEVNDVVLIPKLPNIPDWSDQEKLNKEKEFIGFYISGHPLRKFESIINLYRTNFNNSNGNGNASKSNVNICGIVTDVRYLIDKKNNKMAFVKIEDFENTYEAVVFGSVFPSVEDKLKPDAPLLLRGRLNSELDDPVIKIICEEAYYLEDAPSILTDSIILRIDKTKLSDQNITYLKNVLHSYPGKSQIYFRVAVNGKEEVTMVSKKLKVAVNSALLSELEKILQPENIKIKVKN